MDTVVNELENILKVNNIEYNINAVQASRVENALAAKKIELNKDDGTPNTECDKSDFFEYNGSSAVSPVLVPASGGRFEGRITVPNATSTEIEKDTQTVLNYADTVGIVLKRLLDTSAMATWDEIDLELNFTNGATVNGLCVVKGKETGVALFAEFNYNNKLNASPENLINSKNAWVSDYLYICTDTGNLFLGSADSTETIQLATSTVADDVLRVLTRVNLASDANNIVKATDGSDMLELGVNGVLPEVNGGTGESSIKAAIAKNINVDNSHDDTTLNNPGMDIAPRSIQVGKGRSRWLLPEPIEPASNIEYDSYGINLRNSDIINVNSLWFADKIDTNGEGIMFLRRTSARAADANDPEFNATTYNLDENDSWDRFYVKDGVPFLIANEAIVEKTDTITSKLFYSGDKEAIPVINGGTGQTSLDKVTVGQADKVKVNYKANTSTAQTTKYVNITIAPSESYPNGPASSVGTDGDIMILF